MPRYKSLSHISRKKRVTRKILLKQVIKLYDLEHADYELEVVDEVERLLGLEVNVPVVFSVGENEYDYRAW
jgi:hypothetical protein